MTFYYLIEDMEDNIIDEFEFEVEEDELSLAYNIILNRYDKDKLIGFIMEGDTIEDFRDELKEYFEEEAIKWRKDTK